MAGRQDETVAVWPVWITRVVPERSVPERIRHGRRPHRQPRMARVGLLHHVHRQKAERVDAQFIQCRWSSYCCESCRRCHNAICLSLLNWAELGAGFRGSKSRQELRPLHLEACVAALRVLAFAACLRTLFLVCTCRTAMLLAARGLTITARSFALFRRRHKRSSCPNMPSAF